MRAIGLVIAGAALLAACGSNEGSESFNVSAEMEVGASAPAADDAVEAVEGASPDPATPVAPPGPAPAPAGSLPPPTAAGTANGDIFCRPLRLRMTAAACRDFEEQAASLESGIGAFNPPTEMVRGRPEDVIFAVGAVADRQEVVETAGGNAATAVLVSTKIGRFMTATLTGGGFTIAADGPAERDLGAAGSQTWTWRVTPRTDGAQPLQLAVSVEAVGPDGKRTAIRLSNKTVTVRVAVAAADRRTERVAGLDRAIKEATPLFGSLRAWLLGLVGVIAAASAVWVAIRTFGRDGKEDSAGGPKGPSAK